MLRFVLTPDGDIVPDLYKKLPGKGVYVTNSYALLKQAILKNIFAKILKKKIKVNKELLQMVENVLHKNALSAISLAKKTGDVVIGLDKVMETLKASHPLFVVIANNSGDDGVKKLQNLTQGLQVYRLFSVEELDKTLDRVNTVYMAFLNTKMSIMVKDNFDKLSEFLNDKNNGDEF